MSNEKNVFNEITRVLPINIRNVLLQEKINYSKLNEIRIRVYKPIIVVYENNEYFLDKECGLTKYIDRAYYVEKKEVDEILQYVSNYSMYAYEEEIKQGYITILGGHRIGLAGRVVLEKDRIKTLKDITCINIRVSHEVIGCAKKVIPYIYDKNKKDIGHLLIISPPMGGKTTLLRDIIRIISSEYGTTVGIVDERSEIAACYNGIPQNDIGIRTDVMDCCPKSEGMIMLIRTMAPNVIAVDEIGTQKDIEAIEYVINCGCKLLTTVHGRNVEDIKNKPVFDRLVKNRYFERYIIMDRNRNIGHIKEILDVKGEIIYSDH